MIDQCPLVRRLQMHDVEFPRYLRRAGISTSGLRRSRLHWHHVWPGRRVDVPSNLIQICSVVHDYLHDIGGPPLRVASIYARSRQPNFCWDELNTAAGINVLGWLSWDKCDGLPAPYCWWREELLQLTEETHAGT